MIVNFSDEEIVEVLEVARLGLGMVFTEIAEEMDISDEYLLQLREKIELATGEI